MFNKAEKERDGLTGGAIVGMLERAVMMGSESVWARIAVAITSSDAPDKFFQRFHFVYQGIYDVKKIQRRRGHAVHP